MEGDHMRIPSVVFFLLSLPPCHSLILFAHSLRSFAFSESSLQPIMDGLHSWSCLGLGDGHHVMVHFIIPLSL